VRNAARRVQAGQPYGPINDELNGYWEGPFASIQEAEALNRELEKQPKIAAEFVFADINIF
jgi:hypothetical protein